MELSKDLLDKINAAVEADQVLFKQSARDLGLTLNEGAISGRRQGYFKGMMDEALRSQRLVECLKRVRAYFPDTTDYARVIDNALTQYNLDFVNLKEQV